MQNNFLKKIGFTSSLISLISFSFFLIAFLIWKIVITIKHWIIRIKSNPNDAIADIIVLSLILLFTFGILIFILGESLEFFFKKYPPLVLEKKKVKLKPEDIEKITVIIPAYNEEKTIEEAIVSIRPYCNKIIVVDDGSKDRTAEIAKKNGAIVVTHKLNMGLGTSVKDGIKKALDIGSEIIVNFDADLQYQAEDISSLVYYLIYDNYDLVVGTRFKGTIEKMSIMKKIGNKLYTLLLRYLIKMGISDGQTGFRAFTAEFATKIKIRGDFTYTQEMFLEAAANKAKIGEIPIFFSKRKHGKSRLMKNPFHFASASGIFLLKVLIDLNPLKIYSLFSGILLIFGFYIGGIEILDWFLTSQINSPNMAIIGIILIVTSLIINSFALLITATKNK